MGELDYTYLTMYNKIHDLWTQGLLYRKCDFNHRETLNVFIFV